MSTNDKQTAPKRTAIIVAVENGVPCIDGRVCSYETIAIRSEIHDLAIVNSVFTLPEKYTYVVTEVNGFAKIVHAEKVPVANDNETALMQSIARRKTELQKHKDRYYRLRDKESLTAHCLNSTIEAYEIQIAEDEKLLLTEKEQWIKAHLEGQEYSDSPVQHGNRDIAEAEFNQKYGR